MTTDQHLVEVDKLVMYFPVLAGVMRRRVADVKAVVLDIHSGFSEGFSASLWFQTRPDWDGFESRPIFIRPGWNRNLRFPLNLDDFKSSKTGWKNHDSTFHPRNDVSRTGLVLYNLGVAGEVRVDSIRFEK